jgi:hypothetical protein
LNKRIAVRRIETPARDYLLMLSFDGVSDPPGYTITQDFECFIPSSYSIAEALSAIMVQSGKTGWTFNPAADIHVELRLTFSDNTVHMNLKGDMAKLKIDKL